MKICLTGYRNTGKSTFIDCIKKYNWEVYMADDFIHEIYKKNRIGYEFISNTFGLEYTTSIEVDRIKLNELVLRDRESLIKLNEFCHKQIYEWIESLNGEKVIVELAIYMLSPSFFEKLFNKVILVERKNNPIDVTHISKFLTFPVNFKPDYVLENNSTIEEYIKNNKIFCETLNNN